MQKSERFSYLKLTYTNFPLMSKALPYLSLPYLRGCLMSMRTPNLRNLPYLVPSPATSTSSKTPKVSLIFVPPFWLYNVAAYHGLGSSMVFDGIPFERVELAHQNHSRPISTFRKTTINLPLLAYFPFRLKIQKFTSYLGFL
jgi:hypothetical protein